MKNSLVLNIVSSCLALVLGIGLARLCLSLDQAFPAATAAFAQAGKEPVAERGSTPSQRFARVITMSPALTECMFILGLGDRVVGVSQFSVWPPAAMQKPKVGGWVNPSFEKIVALKPDLILVQGEYGKLRRFAARWKIDIRTIKLFSVADIVNSLEKLGVLMGVPERGKLEALRIRLELQKIRAAVAPLPKPRVLFVIGREPGSLRTIYTAGKGSFLTGLIDVAGGRNIFADLRNEYPVVSLESIAGRAPEIIIETLPGRNIDGKQKKDIIAQWRTLSVPAVRSSRIYLVTESYVLIPGPRIADSARRLAEIIHPEARF